MAGHNLDALMQERQRRLLQAELARRKLSAFISYTNKDYVHSGFSLAVCEALDQFLDDARQGKRPILVLQAPPQHGKSEIVSRRLPAYIFGRWPDARIAACSYAKDLAVDMNRDVQRIMMSDEYREAFPDVWLNPKRVVTLEGQALRNSDRFDITGHKGYYVCTGVKGPLTGKSVDIGIIDDPIKNAEEARSGTVKRAIKNWYDTVFLTRMSKTSGQIIMATAWAVDDLSALVMESNPNARSLKFKAIQDDGTALVPSLHSVEKLLQLKSIMPPSYWAALYDSSPVIEGGNIFQTDWIKTYKDAEIPVFDEIIQSWDMTFKDTAGSDLVCGQIWGRRRASYYLLDQILARMSFTASLEAVLAFRARWPEATGILIEDKANGPAIIDALKGKVPGVIPIEPDGSKIARAFAVTPLWQAGNVFIPANAPWRPDFDKEMISFPNAAHDDQVDAMTQALRYLAPHGEWDWSDFAND